MTIQMEPKVRLDNGLAVSELAEAMARLYVRVVTGSPAEVTPTPGWTGAARYAAEIYLTSEDSDVQMSAADLGATLRKQYARGVGSAGEEQPWEQLPPLHRLAWESIARFAVWAVQAHDAAAQLGAMEDYRAERAEVEREEKGIVRE